MPWRSEGRGARGRVMSSIDDGALQRMPEGACAEDEGRPGPCGFLLSGRTRGQPAVPAGSSGNKEAPGPRPEAASGPPPSCEERLLSTLQIGLLTPGSSLPRAFPGPWSQWHLSGSLPGHSGATVPDSHRLHFSPAAKDAFPRGGHLRAIWNCPADSRRKEAAAATLSDI